MIKFKLILLLVFIPVVSFSQIGGSGVYDFLNLTNSARIASIGGKNISIYDDDLNFAHQNPALLNPDMHNRIVLNYINYFAGVNFGYAGYAVDKGKLGTFSAGIHYVNYGKFIAADETGIITGEFKASDYAFNLIWSKEVYPNIRAGINLKPIYSHLEQYNSFGIAVDIGITYFNKEKEFATSVLLKNIGTQIKPYYSGHYEPLPMDIQIGISKKLTHAPFRVSLTAHHLNKWNLLYEAPAKVTQISFVNEEEESVIGENLYDILDNTFRHLIPGVDLILLKSFYASLGYNHQRRQEMKLYDNAGFVGFSWGFGIKLKKFGVSYARASYHQVGGSNHFSVYFDLETFGKKEIIEVSN